MKGWFYRLIKNLFRKPEDEIPPPPPLPELEQVEFPEPDVSPGRHPDLVVDFGTTATVVALVEDFQDASGGRRVRLTFLAGETEHSSDMTVDDTGRVVAVGSAAYNDSINNTNHQYYTSLKRYVELESRGARQGITFADIVSGFLQASIRDKYQTLKRRMGHDSKIVISIPNSFNPKAIEDVRQGVVQAITALNNSGDVTSANIRVARESEAIAYLYRRGSLLASAPTTGMTRERQPFEWQTVFSGKRPGVQSTGANERIIVLDVGGGTTDLSLVDIKEVEASPGKKDVSIHVVMNAGVPLGGTDVDKVLLRAAMNPTATPQDIAGISSQKRFDLLNNIRAAKQEAATEFFAESQDPQADKTFKKTLNTILIALGKTLGRGDYDQESTAADFRQEATIRIKKLTQLSVSGLFNLIPAHQKNGIGKILLTGRASQLEQIQSALIEEAKQLGADILSLKHPYHLKLSVAYGCALVRHDEFSGAKLPSGTLGRQLRVLGSGHVLLQEFSGDLPVSGTAPTLWEVICPSPEDSPMDYELCEYRTSLPLDFFNEHGQEEMMWLGCFRSAAAWEVGIRGGGSAFQRVLIAWHPETESYYSIDSRVRPPEWKKPEWDEFDIGGINLITGLPLGFPHEARKQR